MNTSPSKKDLRDFGLLVGLLFPLIVGWLLPILFGHAIRYWTLFIGIPLVFLGIFSPTNLRYFYRKWIGIGNLLGIINSHLILGLIFILVMQPIALIMKLFGYDSLRLKKSNSKSYREFRKNDIIDFEKIF